MRFLGLFAVFATLAVGLAGGCSQSNEHPTIEADCRDDPTLVAYCIPPRLSTSQPGGDAATDSFVVVPDASSKPDSSSSSDASHPDTSLPDAAVPVDSASGG